MNFRLVVRSLSIGLSLILLAALDPANACAENFWTGFRGIGDSHASGSNLPLSWELRGRSPGSWSIRLPGYGQSSAVVWKDTIFATSVSGADKEHIHILAIARADGNILWQQNFSGTQRVKDSDSVSRGAPTPVVDGERVYAVFESGDIVVVTHSGEPVWRKSFVKEFGEIQGPHGYASSPVLADGLLILQVAHAGPSYVLALDAASGEQRWKTDHPSQTGWSSPAVFRREGVSQIILSTSGSVRALDASTGKELWMLNDIQGNSTASPTIEGNYIVIGGGEPRGGGRGRGGKVSEGNGAAPSGVENAATSEKPAPQSGSLVIRWDDSASPSIAWQSPKVSSGYASPLVLDGLAYFVNKVGVVLCVEVATGEMKWQHRLPGQAWASPVACNGHILCFCKEGAVVALKAGPELVEVAESQISATDIVYGVAADDSSWIIRTGRGLIRIQADGAAPK